MSYEIITGTILHANPHANTYTVAANGRGVKHFVGYRGGGSSLPTGPSSLRRLMPGETVDILAHTEDDSWHILGVQGPHFSSKVATQPGGIVPLDSHTAFNDPVLHTVTRDYAIPTDATLYSGSSDGSINEFGIAYGHTMLHAFLRASPICAVETFLQDHLLRLSGYNIDCRTAMGEDCLRASGNTATRSAEHTWFIHESRGKNSPTETLDVASMWETLFPQAGSEDRAREEYEKLKERAQKPGADVVDRQEFDRVRQVYEQYQADHPQILPRRVTLDGYLGNGRSDWVVKPGSLVIPEPQALSAATGLDDEEFNESFVTTRSKGSTPLLTGLSEIQQAADGRIRLSSAKGLSLVKEVLIPVPHRVSADPDILPSHFDTGIVEEPKPVGSPLDRIRRADQRELLHRKSDRRFIGVHPSWNYDFNKQGVLSHYFSHADKESQQTSNGVDYTPPELVTHEYALPPSAELKVDAVTKEQYFCGRAGIFITDDGGIVLQDAYGASITLSGGNIYLNCPGDVWQMPGRDANTWAGRGVNIKSQGDLEAVSSLGNVRVKAQNQVSVLGGAGGTKGGVLIQSKGEDVSELLDGAGKSLSTGGIVLESATHISADASKAVGVRSPNMAMDGKLAVSASIHTPEVRTDLLHAKDGDFGGVSDRANSSIYATTSGGPGGVANPKAPETSTIITSVRSDKGFIAPLCEFSFNSSEEYGIGEGYGLVLTESLWQTRARKAGSTKRWTEPELGGPTGMPHPGKDAWKSQMISRPLKGDGFVLDPDQEDVYDFETVTAEHNIVIN